MINFRLTHCPRYRLLVACSECEKGRLTVGGWAWLIYNWAVFFSNEENLHWIGREDITSSLFSGPYFGLTFVAHLFSHHLLSTGQTPTQARFHFDTLSMRFFSPSDRLVLDLLLLPRQGHLFRCFHTFWFVGGTDELEFYFWSTEILF